jgi:hypothetical protein
MQRNIFPVHHCFRGMVFWTFSLDFYACVCDRAFITLQETAHTRFAYGSHYFWRQNSNNSKMGWHCSLMWSMLICILWMAFVMEVLELYWGNTSISIQIEGNPSDMFWAVHCCLRETGPHQYLCCTCSSTDWHLSGHIWNGPFSECSLAHVVQGAVVAFSVKFIQ